VIFIPTDGACSEFGGNGCSLLRRRQTNASTLCVGRTHIDTFADRPVESDPTIFESVRQQMSPR